jgi:hypothetical protein
MPAPVPAVSASPILWNVKVGQVAAAVIDVDFTYEEGEGGPFQPVARNIGVRDVTCNRSKFALQLRGYKNAPIQNVRVEHCTFNNVEKPNVIENVQGLALVDIRINGKKAG